MPTPDANGVYAILCPPSISRGSSGGPKFNTLIVPSVSGGEKRNARWDQALYEASIGIEHWSQERLEEVLGVIYTMYGQDYGFLFFDWADFSIGCTYVTNGVEYGTPVQFATGDGATTAFQLYKTYNFGSLSYQRKITRLSAPDGVAETYDIQFGGVSLTLGTAQYQVFVNSVLQVLGTDYTCDESTGVFTFATAPSSGHAITFQGIFYVAVRLATDKCDMNLDSMLVGKWAGIPVMGIRE